jgi:hypothetical protein
MAEVQIAARERKKLVEAYEIARRPPSSASPKTTSSSTDQALVAEKNGQL